MEDKTNISVTMQDHLEAIYHLTKINKVARVKELAGVLNLSKASVSHNLKHLEEKGLINHDKYSFATLTSQGFVEAEKIVQRHRVISNFFYQILKLDQETADSISCVLEHIVDNKVIERVMEFLDFVSNLPPDVKESILNFKKDAGGMKDAECKYEEQDQFNLYTKVYTTLMDLKPGTEAEIIRIKGKGEFQKRLADLGLIKGRKLKVERVAPLGDPIYIIANKTRLSIRKDDAYCVEIKILKKSGKENQEKI